MNKQYESLCQRFKGQDKTKVFAHFNLYRIDPTTGDLPQFFSELNSLLNSFGDYELTVIQCDCEVQKVETFDGYNPFHAPEWEACGHGGTDFRPPFDYVAGHSEVNPSCLIYITDGCGPAPDHPPAYPVLWLLTSDGAKPAEWGWELRLRGG